MDTRLTLHEAENTICSAITADNFFDIVADTLYRLVDSDIALMGLIETGNPVMDILSVSGDKGDLNGQILLLKRNGEAKNLLCGELAEGRLHESKIDSIHASDFLSEDHHYLVAPLISEEKIVGVIEVLREADKSPFTTKEKNNLKYFGSFCGTAFSNYQIFNQIYNYAVSKEKDRISKDMHDHICQQVGYLKIQAELLNEDVSANNYENVPKMSKDIRRVLDTVYLELRDYIDELRGNKHRKKRDANNPAVFYKTIGEMLQRYHEATGISTELMIAKEAGVLYTKEVASQLTMIIQEALTNIQKHAEAKGVLVMFRPGKGKHILLTIEDDGKGFKPSEVRNPDGHQHYGMHIMQERAEIIHATFEVESKLGEGTLIRVVIPSEPL